MFNPPCVGWSWYPNHYNYFAYAQTSTRITLLEHKLVNGTDLNADVNGIHFWSMFDLVRRQTWLYNGSVNLAKIQDG